MYDWPALFQTFLASGLASGMVGGILVFVFKIYAERKIDHAFNLRLKEYEAWLRRATELQLQIGKDRIEEYKKLSALILSVRKHVVELCENREPSLDMITTVTDEVKDLEKLIYDLSFTLTFDNVYQRLHGFKCELLTLVKNVDNERKLRSNGQPQRAEGVRNIINQSIPEIQGECKLLVEMLKTTIVRDSTTLQDA
jgi:hypothetical protein